MNGGSPWRGSRGSVLTTLVRASLTTKCAVDSIAGANVCRNVARRPPRVTTGDHLRQLAIAVATRGELAEEVIVVCCGFQLQFVSRPQRGEASPEQGRWLAGLSMMLVIG
jgi:hypothetical protein